MTYRQKTRRQTTPTEQVVIGRVRAGYPSRSDSEPQGLFAQMGIDPADCFDLTIDDDSLDGYGVRPSDRLTINAGYCLHHTTRSLEGQIVCAGTRSEQLLVGRLHFDESGPTLHLPFPTRTVRYDASDMEIIGPVVCMFRDATIL